MYDIVLTNPVIMRNGEVCDDCEIISYENNVLVFYVPHWTAYYPLGGPYCGDAICNGDETCSSCSGDCGSCSTGGNTGGGGGGGGGGSTRKQVVAIPCSEGWICDEWSPAECPEDETQKRICVDVNKCGTYDRKPTTTRSCSYVVESFKEEPDLEQPQEAAVLDEVETKQGILSWNYILIGLIIVVLAGLLGFVVHAKVRSSGLVEEYEMEGPVRKETYHKLLSYILLHKKGGLSLDDARSKLEGQGWNKEILDYVFNSLKK